MAVGGDLTPLPRGCHHREPGIGALIPREDRQTLLPDLTRLGRAHPLGLQTLRPVAQGASRLTGLRRQHQLPGRQTVALLRVQVHANTGTHRLPGLGEPAHGEDTRAQGGSGVGEVLRRGFCLDPLDGIRERNLLRAPVGSCVTCPERVLQEGRDDRRPAPEL